MTRRISLLTLLCAGLGMLACTSQINDDDGVADADTAETSSGSESDTGFEGEDLFACAFTSPCEKVSAHIDTEPLEGLVCAAELVAAGATAVLFGQDVPGPDQHHWDHVVVLLGDGTAVRQIRYREVPTDPWAIGEQTLCSVVVGDSLVAACAEDPLGAACQWDMLVGGLVDCEAVEDRTCADISAILDG